MTRVKEIYDFLDEIAPFKTAMDFDNCGLLVGDFELEVKKVLLSLDITNEVCDEARKLGANLIISHHPIIFRPMKNLSFKNPVAKLAKYEINAICAHTNLDLAESGVNYCLAQTLGLSNLSALSYEKECSLGLTGYLPEAISPENFAKLAKEKLLCKGIRYTKASKNIKKVALCSGSGGNLVENAYEKGADAFLTGEIKHSDILKANQLGISIFDAGHFRTENVVIKPLKNILENRFLGLKFFVSEAFSDNINYT